MVDTSSSHLTSLLPTLSLPLDSRLRDVLLPIPKLHRALLLVARRDHFVAHGAGSLSCEDRDDVLPDGLEDGVFVR